MPSRSANVSASRRERAQARAGALRQVLGAATKAEERLVAAEDARAEVIAAADAKVAAAIGEVDVAYRDVVELAGTEQIAADLLGLPTSRIRSARSTKTAEVPANPGRSK